MFALAFDRRHKILLTRFDGVLTSADIAELDRAVVRFTASHGRAHGVLDFSGLSAVAVPMSKLLQRGQQPEISPGYTRIFVVPNPELFQLAQTFVHQQASAGSGAPLLVSTMREALESLSVATPYFEPVAEQ